MSNQIGILEELSTALNFFESGYAEIVNNLNLLDDSFDITADYPFTASLDEINISKWVETTKRNIEKLQGQLTTGKVWDEIHTEALDDGN